MTSEVDNDDSLVAAARAVVAGSLAAGEYDPELLRRLDSKFTVPTGGLATAPEALVHVPSGRPLHSSGALGAVTVASKRVVRRLLSWYVHPITVDQSRFNEAITMELRRLERRVERIETQVTAAAESDREQS